MKLQKLLFLCLLVSVSLYGSEMSVRSIKLDRSKMLILAKDGKSNFKIIAGESPTAKFAARELEKFLKKSAGCGCSNNAEITFYVGIPPKGFDVRKLPRDGFIIRAIGNDVYIAGRDTPAGQKRSPGDFGERATLYGVYDFLERFAGARFLFPGEIGEYVRKSPDLTIPSMDIVECPDNTVRKSFDRAGQLQANRLRRHSIEIPNCHGLGRLGYIERFSKTHPEYFAMKPNGQRDTDYYARMSGHLCFSSPVTEEIYQDAKAYLSGVSAKERGVYIKRFKSCVWDWNAANHSWFNAMPQDGMKGCCCEKCKSLAEKDPAWKGNQVWKMTVDLQNRLKKEGIKGQITQMAYGCTSVIPPFEIPPEIIVQVAFTGPWASGRDSAWEKQNSELKAWTKKLGHKVYLWNYVCKYAGTNIPDIPCNTPRAVAKYYAQAMPEIYGAYMESESDRVSYQYFNWYIFSKMMWDKSVDGEKLYEETCRDFFGAASSDMLRIFDTLEQLWISKVCANVVMGEAGPQQVAPNERDLWEKIYTDKIRSDLRMTAQQAEQKVQNEHDCLSRVRWFVSEYLGTLDKAAENFKVRQNARAFVSCTISDRQKDAKSLSLRHSGAAPTLIKVWKDKTSLYINAQCSEPKMNAVLTQNYPADSGELWKNNGMEIFLDTKADGREYYQFMISSDGQMSDLKFDGAIYDMKWSSNADLKVFSSENSWSFTLTIPLKSIMPFPKDHINADFARNRVLKGEKPIYIRWSPFTKRNGDVQNFGMLFLKKQENNNLLSDPDFGAEQKDRTFGSWIVSQENLPWVQYDKDEFMFGKQSLVLNNPDHRKLHVVQYIHGLKSGKKYRFEAFCKTDIKNGSVFFQFNDGKRNYSFPNSIHGKTDWTAYLFEFTAPDGIENEKPYIRLYNNSTGNAWFDGIILKEIK